MADSEQLSKPMILIVSDDSDESERIRNLMNDYGFETNMTIPNADSIINAMSEKPALILVNTQFNWINNNGYYDYLKNMTNGNNIPVIILSEKNNIEESLKDCKIGESDFVFKPYEPAELLARVNIHLKIAEYLNEIEEKNKQLEYLNKEKNELLGLTAHDLKNPIYNISMLAKIIRDDEKLTRAELTEFSQDIVYTAEKMLELIKKLLDINAIEQGKILFTPEKINLYILALEIYNNIFKKRANEKNIKFNFAKNSNNPTVFADRNAVIQILDNLISNALKFSPFDKNIYVTMWEEDAHSCIEIRDEGPGINNDDKKKLFGKFVRLSAKPTGEEHSTGLGLSIVKKYVEAMNGTIYCESEYGNGCAFTVKLPKV